MSTLKKTGANDMGMKVLIAYCALGAVIGFTAGVLAGSLPNNAVVPVTVVVVVWLWFWALGTLRELREYKRIIDEQVALLQKMYGHQKGGAD